MNLETENKYIDAGELRLEVLREKEDDERFRSSVRNLLVLIKDFYSADSVVFFWYNEFKKKHKLLTSSESEPEKMYLCRVDEGENILSKTCFEKIPLIYKADGDNKRLNLSYRAEPDDIKSVLFHPVLVEQEIIGTVVCESRIEEFFGEPNIRTLSVFSESIANYIKYYSTYEEFFYQDKLLKLLSSGKLETPDSVLKVIRDITAKFINYSDLYIIVPDMRGYKVLRDASGYESILIDVGSITYNSIHSKKINFCNFRTNVSNEYRFRNDENVKRDSIYLAVPLFTGKKCIGVLGLDIENDIKEKERFFSKIYSLLIPSYLYLNELNKLQNINTLTEDNTFLNNDDFYNHLDSEIYRCRLFREQNLFVAVLKADAREENKNEVTENVLRAIRKYFEGYNQLFKIDTDKIAFVLNSESADKVFLEFEKLRKHISEKIFMSDKQELTTSISGAVKRYDDLTLSKEVFMDEIERMLQLCLDEGGNLIKI